jgi:hypothetical protein
MTKAVLPVIVIVIVILLPQGQAAVTQDRLLLAEVPAILEVQEIPVVPAILEAQTIPAAAEAVAVQEATDNTI